MHVYVPSTFSAVCISHHKLRANRNLTKNKDLENLTVTYRTKNCRIDLSVCFYFHARKGNFFPPTDTKAELPCHHAVSCTEA